MAISEFNECLLVGKYQARYPTGPDNDYLSLLQKKTWEIEGEIAYQLGVDHRLNLLQHQGDKESHERRGRTPRMVLNWGKSLIWASGSGHCVPDYLVSIKDSIYGPSPTLNPVKSPTYVIVGKIDGEVWVLQDDHLFPALNYLFLLYFLFFILNLFLNIILTLRW